MTRYSPLKEYPKIRKHMYLAQWIINGILGILAVILTAFGESPLWYVVTTGVFNFVWTYTGLTAEGNTTPTPEPPSVTRPVVE